MSYVNKILAGKTSTVLADAPDASPDQDVAEKTSVRRGRPLKSVAPALPVVEPGVTLMRSPEKKRAAYILAGRINFHSEIIRVDGDGFAHVKTVPGVIALRGKGFTVVEGS